jgi:hypothetical protein
VRKETWRKGTVTTGFGGGDTRSGLAGAAEAHPEAAPSTASGNRAHQTKVEEKKLPRHRRPCEPRRHPTARSSGGAVMGEEGVAP